MQIDITHRPGNSAAKVSLQAGESITAEGGVGQKRSPSAGAASFSYRNSYS